MPMTLADLRAKIPDELDGLDDQRAVEYVQEAYYPDRSVADVQKALGYVAPAPKPSTGQFSSGFNRSFAEVPGLAAGVGAFAADVVGAEGTRDSLMAYAQSKNADLAKAHAGDASSLTDAWDGKTPWTDWLANSAGYVAGQALQSIATGGVGAIAGKMLAKKGARELAEVAAAKAIAGGATEAEAQAAAIAALNASGQSGAIAGAATGAFAHNEMMELGSIYADAVDEAGKRGRKLDGGDLARIFGAASLAAGVDTAGEALLARGALRGSSSSGGIMRRLATEVPIASAREAATEGIQTGLEHYGAGTPIADAAGVKDIIDSMGVGAVGGALGGVPAARHGRYSKTVEDPSDPLDPHTPPEDKARAAAARADIMSAGSVDEALDAFQRSRLPLKTGAVDLDGEGALARLRAAADLPPPNATIDPETGELVPAPSFKQRHEGIVAQLDDSRTRQHIRESLGPQALNDVLYYVQAANNPNLPGPTSDKMLALAEGLMQRALFQPVPGTGGPIAPQLGAPPASTTPRIGLDTSPTGRMLVDSAGQATPETAAGATSVADQQRAARPFVGDQQGNVAAPPPLEPGGTVPAPTVPSAPQVETVSSVKGKPEEPAAPIEGAGQQRQGAFASAAEVRDYLSNQRRDSQGRSPAAVPQQFADGSWGFTTDKKAVDEWHNRSLKERAASMARGEPQQAPAPRGTEALPEPMEGKNGMKVAFAHSTTKPGNVHVTLFDQDSGNAVGTKIVSGVARAKFEAEKLLGIRKPEEKWFEPRANLARAGVELAPAPSAPAAGPKADTAPAAVSAPTPSTPAAPAPQAPNSDPLGLEKKSDSPQEWAGRAAYHADQNKPPPELSPEGVEKWWKGYRAERDEDAAKERAKREAETAESHRANREAVKGFKVGDILRRKEDGYVHGRITAIDEANGRVDVDGASIPAASGLEVAPADTPIPREEEQKQLDRGEPVEDGNDDGGPWSDSHGPLTKNDKRRRYVFVTPKGGVQINIDASQHAIGGWETAAHGASISSSGYRSMIGYSAPDGAIDKPYEWAKATVERLQAEQDEAATKEAAAKVRADNKKQREADKAAGKPTTLKERAAALKAKNREIKDETARMEREKKEAEAKGERYVDPTYERGDYWNGMKRAARDTAARSAGIVDNASYVASKGWERLAPEHKAALGPVIDRLRLPLSQADMRQDAINARKDMDPAERALMPPLPGDEDPAAMPWRLPADMVLPKHDGTKRSADFAGPVITLEEAKARIAEWKAEAQRQGKTDLNKNKVVFSLFDRTGQWSQPYVDAGYTVIRYDIDGSNGAIAIDLLKDMPIADIREVHETPGMEVVGVLAAPPCTSFSSSGARWWAERHDAPNKAWLEKTYGEWAPTYFDTPLDYANTLVAVTQAFIEFAAPTQFHAVENPVGRIQEQNGLPDPLLTFDPNHFGDPYTKKTLLWGDFNEQLPTAHVEPTEGSTREHSKISSMTSGDLRRSETPEGFAYAFFMANHDKVEAERLRDRPAARAALGMKPIEDGDGPIKEVKQRDGTAARKRARQRMALDPENDTMLQALAKLGGIKRDVVAKEFGLKPEELKHTVTVGGLKGFPFRATGGMDLDTALESLTEMGYFRGIADEDIRPTFEAAIFDEIAGNARRTPEGTIKAAQLQFTEAELDREGRLREEADVTPEEEEAITDDMVEAVDASADGDDPVAAMRAMGYTDKEIADELEHESRQSSGAEDPETRPGQAPRMGDDAGSAPGTAPAFDLASQDEEGLKGRAKREADAAAADAAEQKRLADKQQADAEVGDFTLTGSDRAADVAAARGQKGMFDEDPPQGKEWVRHGASGIFAAHQLKVDGKPMIEVRHAGHPTAIRPYYLVGPGMENVPTELAQRKYTLLADAKAAAEGYIDNPPARETDDELRAQLRDVEGQILAAAPAKLQAGGGDIEAAARHPNVPKALKAARGDLKGRLQERRAADKPAEADLPAERDWTGATDAEIEAEHERLGKEQRALNQLQLTQPIDSAERSATVNRMDDLASAMTRLDNLLDERERAAEEDTAQAEADNETPFEPLPGWRESLYKARDYAKHLGLSLSSDLKDLVKRIDINVGAPNPLNAEKVKVGDKARTPSGATVTVKAIGDDGMYEAEPVKVGNSTVQRVGKVDDLVPTADAAPAKITASQAWAGADEKGKRAMLKAAGLDDLAEKKNVASWGWDNLSGRARAALMKGQKAQPAAAKVQPETAKPLSGLGFDAVRLSNEYTMAQLNELRLQVEKQHANPGKMGEGGFFENGRETIHLYDKAGRKKLDEIARAVTFKLQDKRDGIVAPADRPKESPPAKSNAKAVEKIRAVAQKTIEDGEAKYGQDRNTNTARRARMASGAEADAAHRIFIGKKMLALADAVENGTAPALANVDSRLLVEQLQSIRTQAMYAADRKAGMSYSDQEKRKGRAWEPQDVAFIEYPSTSWNSGELDSLRGAIKGKKGSVELTKKINFGTGPTAEILASVKAALGEAQAKQVLGPWVAERVARVQRLKNAGIPDLAALKAAILEYNALPAEGQKVDRVKQLERALVGNKGIGVDFFPTPKPIAERMVAMADIRSGMTVLEPSAGNGVIADAIRNAVPEAELHTVEVSDALREILEAKGHKLMARDFLSYKPEVYDRIVMNPPFGHGTAAVDAEHVKHAFSLLKPGGRVVAIVSEGLFGRSDSKATAFRDWIEEHGGVVEKLEAGTFNDRQSLATTGTATRIVVIDKNRVAAEERAVYEVREDTGFDLFGDPIPEPIERPTHKPRSGSDAAKPMPADPLPTATARTLAVRPDEAMPGLYRVTSQLVQVGEKTISVDKVNDWQSAVTALSDMHVFAVEHFDVIVTDAQGAPLAIIGSFKGAQAQASVYPTTLLAEALRIKGAKHAWAVHNHPSGNSALSDADKRLKAVIFDVFRGTRVRFEGVAAIGGNTQDWTAIDPYGRETSGKAAKGDKSVTVPIVERTLSSAGDTMHGAVTGPPQAKDVTAKMSAGQAGIMFMDNQNVPTAWVPITPDEAANLVVNNRLDKLLNAAGNAGAASAILANPGGVYDDKTIANLGTALAHVEVRLVDSIDTVAMTSDAEKGLIGGYSATSTVQQQRRNYVVETLAGHKVEEPVVDSMWSGMRGFDQTAARNLFLDAVTRHGGTGIFNAVNTQYAKAQKNPQTFGRVFNAVQDFIKDVSTFANAAGDLAPNILPKLDSLRDVLKHTKRADLDAAGAQLWQGTLVDQREYTRKELADRGLTEHQADLYFEGRAAINQSLDDMVRTELVRLAGDSAAPVERAAMAAPSANAAAEVINNFMLQQGDDSLVDVIADKLEQLQRLKDEGYAPLMRFGRHTVHFVDKDGRTLFFSLHESRMEANQRARELQSDPELKGAKLTQGLMSQKAFEQYQGLPLDALELFAESTGNRNNPVYQDFLKLTKSNRSVLKRLIHRQGIAGYSEDTARVLAAFTTSNARYASGNLHLARAQQAADAIPKELGDLKDDAIKLVQYVQNPQEEAGALRGLLFANFIGGSVASAAVNLTQPFTMSLPYLSQFGGTIKAMGHLASATRAAAGGSIDPMMEKVLHRNADIVSPQEIHHLQSEALGKANPWVKKAAFVWGSLFSLSEQFNRRVTFIAAYNAALQQHIDAPEAFARKAVIETQGLYNKGNKPNLARGAIGGTVMTFKQFSIHYLEFLGRMWHSGPEGKKAVGLALGVLVLVAGAGGLPFADDLDDAIDTLAQALGYDFNSKKAKRQFVAKYLGETMAGLATRGVSGIAGFPIDVSLRMGLGNLLPATGILLRSNTDRSRDVLELAGAGGSFLKSGLDAGQAVLAGHPAKGALTVAPLAIQNLAKAAEMWNTGEYRNKDGKKVMDVSLADTIAKGIGFQPGDVAKESQLMGETQRSIDLAKNVQQDIARRWANALNDGDTKAVADARAELREWNQTNPDSRLHITMQSIIQRVREMRMDRATRTIKHAPIGMRAEVREALQ